MSKEFLEYVPIIVYRGKRKPTEGTIMGKLSLKEFIENLTIRLEGLSNDELKKILLDYAESLPPGERAAYLDIFVTRRKTGGKKKKASDGDYLLREIEAFEKRADDFEYSTGWGWDDEYGKERAWGNDNWTGEIDDLFGAIEEFYQAGDYALAVRAYEKLLDIYFGGSEEGQFSGYDQDKMMATDIQKATLKYLRCVYMTEKVADRRTDAIVGSKYRKSYWKAAQLLPFVAEVYWSNDER